MESEAKRVAEQLRRAFTGDAWHGASLRELLNGVTAEQAAARLLASGHTIWELALHIDIWVRVALGATEGIPMPRLYGTEKDWPATTDVGAIAWAAATGRMFEGGELLARAIAGFDDARLKEIAPGREYDFYHLFHGIVQHSLYHGGQIAILKRALGAEER